MGPADCRIGGRESGRGSASAQNDREHQAQPSRAQGTARDAVGRRLSFIQRPAAGRIQAIRKFASRSNADSGRPFRQHRSGGGERKSRGLVHRPRTLHPNRRRPAWGGTGPGTGQEVYRRKYQGKFILETVIIDACAMKLVLNPWQFDVLVTTNLFGDILSDLVAGLVGGLGMTPGANIGADAAIFEAVHGSAPDIAGKGIANPIALLLAAAMMLEHCHLPHMATRLRTAIEQTLNADNVRTGDLGGKANTAEFTRALIARIGR